MDETPISQLSPQTSFGPSPSAGKKKFLLPVVVILVLLGAIFGGANYLRSRNENIPTPTPFPTQAPTATPTPTVEPTATPKATPTKKPTPTKEATSSAKSKGLSVRVLNGSGKTGAAADLVAYLEGLGYESGGVGNTDSSDTTTISIKSSKSSLLSALKADVATKYQVGTTDATLSATLSYDALVIIGKQ